MEGLDQVARCVYCNQKKAKRYCPALHGEICAVCCGTYRVDRINCTQNCVYLEQGKEFWALRLDEDFKFLISNFLKKEYSDNMKGVIVNFLGNFLAIVYWMIKENENVKNSDLISFFEKLHEEFRAIIVPHLHQINLNLQRYVGPMVDRLKKAQGMYPDVEIDKFLEKWFKYIVVFVNRQKENRSLAIALIVFCEKYIGLKDLESFKWQLDPKKQGSIILQ